MEHLQLDASRTIDVGEIELKNLEIADPDVIKEKLSALSKQQQMYPKASIDVNTRFSFVGRAPVGLDLEDLGKPVKS